MLFHRNSHSKKKKQILNNQVFPFYVSSRHHLYRSVILFASWIERPAFLFHRWNHHWKEGNSNSATQELAAIPKKDIVNCEKWKECSDKRARSRREYLKAKGCILTQSLRICIYIFDLSLERSRYWTNLRIIANRWTIDEYNGNVLGQNRRNCITGRRAYIQMDSRYIIGNDWSLIGHIWLETTLQPFATSIGRL